MEGFIHTVLYMMVAFFLLLMNCLAAIYVYSRLCVFSSMERSSIFLSNLTTFWFYYLSIYLTECYMHII